jgi:hypothetical protein
LAALDRFGIEYLIVGGVAVGFHAEPRFTKDLDVLVHVDSRNVGALIEALSEFGAPMHFVKAGDFLKDDFVFFFGSPPWRIDLLTSIPGIEFRTVYADRVTVTLGNRQATCISKEWLIKAKKASGRHQDLADLEALQDKLDVDEGQR